jgi:hypothetical protein
LALASPTFREGKEEVRIGPGEKKDPIEARRGRYLKSVIWLSCWTISKYGKLILVKCIVK